MGLCKECKHWEKSSEYIDYFTCNNDLHKTGYGYDLETLKPNEILIESDEGWCWITGPEFGCINFEQK